MQINISNLSEKSFQYFGVSRSSKNGKNELKGKMLGVVRTKKELDKLHKEALGAIQRIRTRIDAIAEAIEFHGEVVELDVFEVVIPMNQFESLRIDGNYWGHGLMVIDHPRARSVLVCAKDEDINTPAHTHPHAEVGVVIQGEIHLAINGKRRVYGKNDTFTVMQGTIRKEYIPQDGEVLFTWTK
jgi:hypothetical protein